MLFLYAPWLDFSRLDNGLIIEEDEDEEIDDDELIAIHEAQYFKFLKTMINKCFTFIFQTEIHFKVVLFDELLFHLNLC